MPQSGFEPTISAGERPQIYALDREATGTGTAFIASLIYYTSLNNPYKTKRRLIYLKTQFVPRSKHFSSRL